MNKTFTNQTSGWKQFPKQVIPELLSGRSPVSLAEGFNFGQS